MKYVLILLLWILCIGFMIQDYAAYPPLPSSNPLSNRINNMEGGLLKYGLISSFEYILLITLIYKHPNLSNIKKYIVAVGLIILCSLALLDAMFAGGVPVLHFFGLLAILFYFSMYTAIITYQKRSSKTNVE